MSDKQTMTVTFTNEGESMGIEFNYDPPLNEANQVTEEQRIMQNIAKGATYKVMEFLKPADAWEDR